MKKLICILLCLFFASSIQAASVLDNIVFGVSLIRQDVNLEINTSGSTVNRSESGTGLGVYIDKYYKRKLRFNSTFSYVGYDSFNLAELTVAADYLVPLNRKVSFFAGLSGGGGLQKFSDSGISDASLGLIYGAEIGGIAYVDSNLMLESGYRKKISNIKTEVTSVSGTNASLDEVNEFYFSFLLMF